MYIYVIYICPASAIAGCLRRCSQEFKQIRGELREVYQEVSEAFGKLGKFLGI